MDIILTKAILTAFGKSSLSSLRSQSCTNMYIREGRTAALLIHTARKEILLHRAM